MTMGTWMNWFAGGVLVACASAACAEPAMISNEDLRHIRSLSDPRISPDGSRVLLAVTEATADGGASHVWLVDAMRNVARQVTFSRESEKTGERHARWLGNADVLFLAKRGERTQIYRLPMAGGEARPLDLKIAPPVDASTAADAIPPRKADAQAAHDPLPLEIDGFECSPDGHTVAVLASDPETPGEKKQKEEKADAVWVDHDEHGKRLYVFDADSGSLTAVGVGRDVVRAVFDRSGGSLMVLSEAPNGLSDLGPTKRAWLVAVKDPAHPEPVKELPSTIEDGAFSDDGGRFYFRAQSPQDVPPGYPDVFVLDLKTRRIDDLAPDFMGTFGGGRMLIAGGDALHSAQTGTRLGYVRLGRGKVEQISFATPVVSGLDADAKRSNWVWLGQGSDEPAALYYGPRPGSDARTLSTPALLPHAFARVSPQHVTWSNEGLSLEGLLWLPPATGKVPLIVDIHGGPTGAWDERFEPLVHYLLAQGWAVFRPNIRGSTAYGHRFAAANKNDLGGGDYRDIMSGVDTLLAGHSLDGTRMALIGYSYGGEMAGFVEGKTDRFKAVVSGAPVIDQYSEYGSEDSSWYDRWFYGKPWEHPEDAWRQSPLSLAAHARSPFLLIQGEADHVDPLGQSLEMYRALRQAGVHVELVQYPREDHGPLSGGLRGYPNREPWHGFDARQRLVKFIGAAFAGQ